MRHPLFRLLGAVAFVAAIWAPASASAVAAPEIAPASSAVVVASATSPTPPVATSPAPGRPSSPGVDPSSQMIPTSGGSSTLQDVLTVVGFSIVAMAGFVLLLRAGLRSAASEDDD